ncbi:leucine-rich repeat receptor-like serine/threonine-protein kinase BAM1 [Vigna angularis]|uniref:leucine-rich repeat receptor-like serine/threonine-protein kinase BAM1 n=1 Tax=Phaseolus angularis TaxID=3914 RepID=UPI000809BB12|nr:leucine-rich repeat receptor-like serine/threonine-protein kinase BAM1 [Vigna angularis]
MPRFIRNRGRFSPSLDPHFLSYLSLADNQFFGPIPASFSALSALRHLNLSNNAFNATFPSNLARLANLQVLDLYNNNMTGPVPSPSPSSPCPLLRHLHLGNNFFSGQIPPKYGTWQHLTNSWETSLGAWKPHRAS